MVTLQILVLPFLVRVRVSQPHSNILLIKRDVFIAIKFRFCNIGIWCNGNTADSGPAFPGSSPGIPTQSIHLSKMDAFFVQLISLPYFFYVTLH